MTPIDRYAVVGHPVAHSRSPWIHARFAAQTGQSLEYERLLAPLDGFEATVRGFAAAGARGCNVTVPFKFEAFKLAAQRTPRAQLAQAANVLCFDAGGWRADNSDGIGLVHDIERHAGVPIEGARLLLIGAGGAAAGVLGPLIERRPAAITLANRTRDRAAALAARHAVQTKLLRVRLRHGGLDELGSGHDIVINATAGSLAGEALDLPADLWRAGGLALDMMYGPAARQFLDAGVAQGAEPRDGLGMLVEQAAEAFAIWRGVRPDTVPVLAELRTLVDQGVPT